MNQINPPASLLLFAGDEHTCPYLPDRMAITAFVDPDFPLSVELYDLLLERGFRRSGSHVYRPHCPNCQECIAVRIPVDRFKPNRNQRRILNRHTQTRVQAVQPEFSQAHFQMYKRYLSVRHEGSEMNVGNRQQYMEFLTSNWCETVFYEFLDSENRCFAVSVVDQLPQGLSALYTFFEPDRSDLSPGQYAILWLIEEAKRTNRNWLYLGYWIDSCDKMSYKVKYRPIQALLGSSWKTLDK